MTNAERIKEMAAELRTMATDESGNARFNCQLSNEIHGAANLLHEIALQLPAETPPAFDPSKPVQTRDGREVKDLAHMPSAVRDSRLCGVIDGRVCLWMESGKFNQCSEESPNDLINTPPKTETRKLGYINVYPDSNPFIAEILADKNQCKKERVNSGYEPIACVPVEITYTEGEGL